MPPSVKAFFQSNVLQRRRLRRIVLVVVVFALGIAVGSWTRPSPLTSTEPLHRSATFGQLKKNTGSIILDGDTTTKEAVGSRPVGTPVVRRPQQAGEPSILLHHGANGDALQERQQRSPLQQQQQGDDEANALLAQFAQHAAKGIQCPPYDAAALDSLQIPLKHLPRKKKTSVAEKYNRRAHNCASNGIWNRVTIEDHHKILHGIARLGKIESGSYILDWGSGCGHSMQFLFDEKNATGVGIDVSNLTIAYATANTSKANLHCVADGTRMAWIPSNSVDHAYSFGSIYHVYNRTLFCHVLRQLVRIIRPGGTVYNGWTENAEYKRVHVPLCLDDLPVSYHIYEEKVEFANVQIFPLKAHQDTPNTYSLVITKNLDATAGDVTKYVWDQRPMECGVHVCEKRTVPAAVVLESWELPYVERHELPNYVPHAQQGDQRALVGTKEGGQEDEETPQPQQQAGNDEGRKRSDASLQEGEVQATTDNNNNKPEDQEPAADFESWPSCPPYDPQIEERQIPLAHLPRGIKTSVSQKYDRRSNKCAGDGVWHKITLADHESILHRIAQLLEVKSHQILFDWGSGCGHHLAFMTQHYNARGLGIDVSNRTIAYAVENTTKVNRHCVADGTRLEWIPSNFFDHAYSFGSVYHVYNKTLFCHVLQEMVRIVKPGGRVYNGWTENKEFRRDWVSPCLVDGEGGLSKRPHANHKVEVLEEASLFRHVKMFPLKQYREEPNTYSVLVTKED